MPDDPILIEVRPPQPLPDGRVRLSCEVRIDETERPTAWLDIPADAVPATDDWVVPIMVVRAMQLARPVRIAGRVSAKLLDGAARVQQVFAGFAGHFRPRPIKADAIVTAAAVKPRTASFFSGGLDSWYSALANEGSIDDLVFGAGIDMPAANLRRRALIEPIVREAAAAMNKPLLHFETNIREVFRPWKHWNDCFLGSALGTCALALGGRYTRLLIGGAHSLRRQYLQLGTHAHVDPLWSSDTLEIVYDGAIPRVEKARRVATSEAAMRTLRVCGRKDIGEYNCGHCEKCLRTMVELRVVGALERCITFKTPLDLREVAAQRLDNWSSRAFMEESLEAALAAGGGGDGNGGGRDVELIWALRECLAAKGDAPVAATAAPPARQRHSIAFKVRREAARALNKLAGVFGKSRADH